MENKIHNQDTVLLNKKQILKLLLKPLQIKTGRADGQLMMLFELVNFDFNKLVDLEEKLHNRFTPYVPATKEQVELELQNQTVSSKWMDLNSFK